MFERRGNSQSTTGLNYPLLLLAVAGIYVAAGELGLSQALIHANVSPVWPPTGLAIAVVWWLGYRTSPAILLGSFAVNLATGVSVLTAAGIAIGNTLETVSAVFLVNRLAQWRNPFFRAPDTIKFVFVTGAFSTPLSATIGNISLCLGGAADWSNFGALWVTWWLGDAVGALVVTPLLLTWLEKPARRWSLKMSGEGALLLSSLSLIAAIVFGGLFLPRHGSYPLEYLMVPFVLWAAFKFEPSGAATTIALLSVIAVVGTRGERGPFAGHSPNDSLILLQVYMAAIAIMTMILAAIVAERKRTEAAYRGKQAQLRLITDITPIMLTQCNRDCRYTFANRAYADTFGLTPEQIVGKHIVEIIGEPAYETIRPYVDRVLQGQAVQYEAQIPYRRAGQRFMRIAYMPDRDSYGNVIGWVASLTDISDHKLTEEQIQNLNAELQRRIAEFQTLIDTAPVGIGVAMDRECSYIWGNREFAHMLGTEAQNISKTAPGGKELPFKVLRDGKEIADSELPMQRACREGHEVLDEELEIVRSDGSVVRELCRAIPLRDEQGKARGCIAVFLNITERKQAEKEREQLLTREREAREDAETANRVKDEFLAVISHELRTPLNSILGWAQLLRTGKLDAVISARALEAIERNAKTQARLVDDLLDVSRIISGKLRLDTRPLELTSVVQSAVESLRNAFDAKAIQLDVVMDPAASHVQGDATRLQQVVWNLLSNAVKFTSRGGRVEIRLKREGMNSRLTVSDTGEGISPEFLPYVFERFWQEDSSRTRKHGGLGLGLAIVRHIVEMHGGGVEAHSAGERQGASFTVTLPVIEEPTVFENADVPPADALPRLMGMRLLIVEDNPDSLEMLRVVVESCGAEVKTATTTSEALLVVEHWLPDVLVSDIGLPDEDGYTLMGKVRMLVSHKGRNLRAIALTGYAGIQDAYRAQTSGFQMYLTKPTEPATLVKAIAKLVRQ